MPAHKLEFWALCLIGSATDPLNGMAIKVQKSYAPFPLGHVLIWGLMETLQDFAALSPHCRLRHVRKFAPSLPCKNQ